MSKTETKSLQHFICNCCERNLEQENQKKVFNCKHTLCLPCWKNSPWKGSEEQDSKCPQCQISQVTSITDSECQTDHLSTSENSAVVPAFSTETEHNVEPWKNAELKEIMSKVLKWIRNKERQAELDDKLGVALSNSGFTKSRIHFHNKFIDFVETNFLPSISINMDWKIFVCGSFGEGWGCNLSCMDGRVGFDSDIDLTQMDDSKLHFEDCSCEESEKTFIVIETEEGHCTWNINRGTLEAPAQHHPATSTQPNRDYCRAHNCACLPRSCTFFTDQNPFPKQLIEKCRSVGVHIVNAQRPGYRGRELRISYSLMEKEIIREFPEIIGRTLIVLKFLFKRELASFKIKSYVVKTLMFYIYKYHCMGSVELISLVQTTKLAIGLFIYFLSHYKTNRKEVCLPHFFQDAPVFFKSLEVGTAKWPDKNELIHELQRYLEDDVLLSLLENIKLQLRLAPDAYYTQLESLYRIADVTDRAQPLDIFTSDLIHIPFERKLQQAPETWTIAVQCLRVLWYLSQENYDDAKQLLYTMLHSQEKDVCLHVIETLNGEQLLKHFETYFSTPNWQWILPVFVKDLKYLPSIFRNFTPSEHHALINFRALFMFLCQEHLKNEVSEKQWLAELIQCDSLDFQELYAFTCVATNKEALNWATKELKNMPHHVSEEHLIHQCLMKQKSQRPKNIWNRQSGYWDKSMLPSVWIKNVLNRDKVYVEKEFESPIRYWLIKDAFKNVLHEGTNVFESEVFDTTNDKLKFKVSLLMRSSYNMFGKGFQHSFSGDIKYIGESSYDIKSIFSLVFRIEIVNLCNYNALSPISCTFNGFFKLAKDATESHLSVDENSVHTLKNFALRHFICESINFNEYVKEGSLLVRIKLTDVSIENNRICSLLNTKKSKLDAATGENQYLWLIEDVWSRTVTELQYYNCTRSPIVTTSDRHCFYVSVRFARSTVQHTTKAPGIQVLVDMIPATDSNILDPLISLIQQKEKQERIWPCKWRFTVEIVNLCNYSQTSQIQSTVSWPLLHDSQQYVFEETEPPYNYMKKTNIISIIREPQIEYGGDFIRNDSMLIRITQTDRKSELEDLSSLINLPILNLKEERQHAKIWVIDEVDRKTTKQRSRYVEQSPAFYTGQPGYRVKLQVTFNNVSLQRPRHEQRTVFTFNILPGIFDQVLEWPCPLNFQIEVVKHNAYQETSPLSITLVPNARVSQGYGVTDRMGFTNSSYITFPQKSVLSPDYVKNDKLIIRLSYKGKSKRQAQKLWFTQNPTVLKPRKNAEQDYYIEINQANIRNYTYQSMRCEPFTLNSQQEERRERENLNSMFPGLPTNLSYAQPQKPGNDDVLIDYFLMPWQMYLHNDLI